MVFQSTRPIRGATYVGRQAIPVDRFQSTRPIRGATPAPVTHRRQRVNFNPRAPYGARLLDFLGTVLDFIISIHAPHTGRDHDNKRDAQDKRISIHAPHTGRD